MVIETVNLNLENLNPLFKGIVKKAVGGVLKIAHEEPINDSTVSFIFSFIDRYIVSKLYECC